MSGKTLPRRTPSPPPRRSTPPRVATSQPSRNQGSQASAPATSAPTPPAPATSQSTNATPAQPKASRKRSPPMGRAVKFVSLAKKNTHRGFRLVDNWRGDMTPEQRAMNDAIVAELRAAAPHIDAAGSAVLALQASGFVPTEARGRAIQEALNPGDRVCIKEGNYHAELHGEPNDFEVVATVRVDRPARGGFPAGTSIQVKLRPVGDVRAPQIVLPQSQLERLEGVLPGEFDDADEEPAPGEAMPGTEEISGEQG